MIAIDGVWWHVVFVPNLCLLANPPCHIACIHTVLCPEFFACNRIAFIHACTTASSPSHRITLYDILPKLYVGLAGFVAGKLRHHGALHPTQRAKTEPIPGTEKQLKAHKG